LRSVVGWWNVAECWAWGKKSKEARGELVSHDCGVLGIVFEVCARGYEATQFGVR
jgi:hypothetical protein